jgi:hypothetical protein
LEGVAAVQSLKLTLAFITGGVKAINLAIKPFKNTEQQPLYRIYIIFTIPLHKATHSHLIMLKQA